VAAMKVENCPKCGGTHWGSYVCPFTDEQIEKMGIKNVHPALGSNRGAGRHSSGNLDRVPDADDIQVLSPRRPL